MIDMVEIPSGNFLMGSPNGISDFDLASFYDERPQHFVTIPSFWMSMTVITEVAWKLVGRLNEERIELRQNDNYENGFNYPVINVSWEEAIEFCARLSILTGRKYRLPSEAEWEYACRAKTTTDFFFGDTLSENQANFYDDAKENKLMPVGQFPPNAFGLYDMHGNVWEWCQDNFHANYNGAPTDGSAWLGNSNFHVLRGGSWVYRQWLCRSAYRCRDFFDKRDYDIGFRVVCSDI
jgi:formylglycine-generating enzyme required for sulfatase activity